MGFVIAVVPALAQQQAPNVPALPYNYGYSHMWGRPWGWHPFMIIGPIFMLLAVIGIMAIFVWLVRWATHGYPFRDGSAAAMPLSTFSTNALRRARSIRPSLRRSASSSAAAEGRERASHFMNTALGCALLTQDYTEC